MFIRRTISGISLLTILFSANPVLAQESGQITIASYSSSGMGFVGKGHCQWWAGSPLGNQNPHVWVGFLGVVLVFTLFIIGKLLRNRMRTGQGTLGNRKIDDYTKHLTDKHRRLMAKIQDAKDKMEKGEISPREYATLHSKYEEMLSDINKKIREVEQLKNE